MKLSRHSLVLALGVLPFTASAGTANFDSQSEGFIFNSTFTYYEAGITFSDLHRNIPGEDPQISWAIEDASADLTSRYPGFFSPNNTLGFGGYAPGTSTGFTRVDVFTMTPDAVSDFVSLEWFGLFNDGNENSATLELYRNGSLVGSSTQVFAQVFDFYHYTLSAGGVEFDEVRFIADGPANEGTLFGVIDNVTMTPVPEPATFAALGLGALALLRRRKK